MTPVARRLNFDANDEEDKMLDYSFKNNARDILYRRTPFNQKRGGSSEVSNVKSNDRIPESYGEQSQKLDMQSDQEINENSSADYYDLQPSFVDMHFTVPDGVLKNFCKEQTRECSTITGMTKAPLALIAKNMNRPTQGPFHVGGPEHQQFKERRMATQDNAAVATQLDSAEDVDSTPVLSSSLLSRRLCVASNQQQQHHLEVFGCIERMIINGKQIWLR